MAAFSLGLSPFSFADKGETSHKGDGAMQRRTTDLKPHPMNRKLYGDEVPPADFIESVRRHGIMVPLAIKEDGTIISGHRRWQAALALKMEHVPVQVVRYADDLDEREAIIEFNRQREKTFSQKMAEAEELGPERERANAEGSENLSEAKRTRSGNVATSGIRKDRDKVAAAVGLGSVVPTTRPQGLGAAKKGDETAKKLVEIDLSKTTVHAAYKAVEERKQERKGCEVANGIWRLRRALHVTTTVATTSGTRRPSTSRRPCRHGWHRPGPGSSPLANEW